MRRACLEQLGGLDPDYFLYYEDVDLCRRAHEKGWSVCYEPSLRAVHHHPLHLRVVPPYLRLLTRHALLTYASKHWPRWQFKLLAWIVGFEAQLRRLHALQRKDEITAELFAEMSAIAADLRQGKFAHARGRLEKIVRREEQSRRP
jgi:GT2 family glycosyltransferase